MSSVRYRVEIARDAKKSIAELGQPAVRSRILKRIAALAEDPRPAGVKKLKGAGDQYRIRQGAYRIIYTIDDGVLLVEVIEVGHRSDIYR